VNVQVHEAAHDELFNSAARYELAVSGLGMDLLAEAERIVALIAEHPAIGQLWKLTTSDVRSFPMRRFPYTVVYAIRGSCLLVVAYAGDRQAPEYWRARL